MIGGRKSFGAGGWQDTPLADILPVDLAASGEQIAEPITVVPTAEGQTAEVMQIDPSAESVAAAWAELDPLPGANRLGGVKPAATVLAQDDAGRPMIVAQRYGKGRTLAVAFDTTWRWVLSEKDTAARQKRFWRQVVLYLAAPRGNVWIHADRTSYDRDRPVHGAQEVKITAGVEDASGAPLRDAQAHITLKTPDGRTTPLTLRGEGPDQKILQGVLPTPTAAGLYTLAIAATVDGKELTAEFQFEVVRRDRESGQVLANFDLLRRMAEAGSGTFTTLNKLDTLLETLRRTTLPRKQTVTETKDLTAAFRWPTVCLLIALLCAEWALRKRKNLV
jgi:hypothetical protein